MVVSGEVREALRQVPSDIMEFVLGADSLRVVTHIRGDADSATIFPLAMGLRKLGKRVECLHDIPQHLDWLIPQSVYAEPTAGAPVLAVDTANFARLALPRAERLRVQELLAQAAGEDAVSREQWWSVCQVDAVIDHHVSNGGYGRLNWIDAKASSSAELVTALLHTLEDRTGTALLDEEMAWRLYTGLVSDTQWFARPVGPSAYLTAARLEERFRIDKVRIAEALRAQSIGYFRLGERLRASFSIRDGVASAFIDITSSQACGVSPDEAAMLIEDLERLQTAISLLFVETPTGDIRVRLRGKDKPVIDLARAFGGGGHTYRAGAVVRNRDEMEQLTEAAMRLVGEPGRGARP